MTHMLVFGQELPRIDRKGIVSPGESMRNWLYVVICIDIWSRRFSSLYFISMISDINTDHSARSMVTRLIAAIRDNLPEGTALPDGTWRYRHQFLLLLLIVHTVAVAGYAFLQGYSVVESFGIW